MKTRNEDERYDEDVFHNGGYCTVRAEKRFFAKYFESHFHDSSSVARMRERGEGESRERCRGRG